MLAIVLLLVIAFIDWRENGGHFGYAVKDAFWPDSALLFVVGFTTIFGVVVGVQYALSRARREAVAAGNCPKCGLAIPDEAETSGGCPKCGASTEFLRYVRERYRDS